MKLKIEWMCFITYCVLCFSLLYEIGKAIEFSVIGIIGCCLGIMLLYLLIWNIVLGFGHLVASIYCCVRGFGSSPLLFYPFMFGASKDRPVQVFWNFFYMCEYYFPAQIYLNKTLSRDKKMISDICKNIQLSNWIAETFLCVLMGSLFFFNGYWGLGLSCILFSITLLIIANMKTDTFHGCFVRIRYIKQGYIDIYLAKDVILYSSENHIFYKNFEEIILNDYREDFEYMCLKTIKNMHMIKCVNDQFLYPDKVKEIVEEKCFLKSMADFKRLDIGDEKFNLMKACLCYSIISENIPIKNLLRHKLWLLAREEENSVIKFNTFQWYLKLLEEEKVPDQRNEKFKNTVLEKNQFLELFTNYREVYMKITTKMLSDRE